MQHMCVKDSVKCHDQHAGLQRFSLICPTSCRGYGATFASTSLNSHYLALEPVLYLTFLE